MTMNKYMHPRNIYKNPPNFKQLAIEYPEFRNYVNQDITGKVTLNFKDINALRALSRTLLLKDFDLNVEIPLNKLIPTIPLRLNYLLWIEDLLSIKKVRREVDGVDIGTGASCVYPLMAAKRFKWKMIATEIDKESVEFARRNVINNLLEDYIQVFQVTQDTLLKEVVGNANEAFDFCMCNPPFFSSTQELHPFFKSRKSNRPHPKNAFCASVGEVVVHGGEVEFISKLIKESSELKDKIIIFTTMVGHKSSLVALKAYLREVGVCSFKQTDFCQGRTTRWGLAWTFQDIDLRSIPTSLKNSKLKSKPPLVYLIPKLENENYTLEHISMIVMKLAEVMKLEVHQRNKSKGSIIYDVIAYSNTWSNQRRKRREKLQRCKDESHVISTPLDVDCSPSISEMYPLGSTNSIQSNDNSQINNTEKHFELQNTSEKLADMIISSSTPKREYEDEDEYYNKRFKASNSINNNKYLAQFVMVLKIQNSGITLELFSLDGDTERETIHQILQYIKNNLK